MPSRRTFLGASGGALAGVLLGTAGGTTAGTTTASAAPGAIAGQQGLRWPSQQLLPTFAPPIHLRTGDVGELSGEDQILLTTLQGVVNRSRPELYFTFDPVDERWLSEMRVRKTSHADPLELVAAYADRVRGAILYDPAIPDTINVATTLAGLENAVVASAEQAAKYGLPVVDDLRGRFNDDRLAIYRWQLRNLFPRCSRTLLVGLPPTMTVQTGNVRWRSVLTEERPIRDSSNRNTYELDLSAELGTGEVFLRFQDSFPNDGWGPSVRRMAVQANGAELARFDAGTTTEEEYLFDAGGSSIGGDSNRFVDGGGYFIYRFAVPDGTTSLTARVEMWNQFKVSATGTAPTTVQPFPYFRDYAVATQSMVSWLPPNGETGELLREVFDSVAPTTPYLGWFANDVDGEWSGVDIAAQHSVEVLPADFYMNGTVHSGVVAPISAKIPPVTKRPLRNKIYLTLTIGEGDNVQYCQRHMRNLWEDPNRGSVPINWTVSPVLSDIGPGLLSHYQRTATGNDLLIAGPSGAGYTYPGSWPQDDLEKYLQLTGRYMRRTGMDLVYAYNHRDDSWWVPFPEEIGRAYAEHTPVRGIIQSWERGGLLEFQGGIPMIGNFYPTGMAEEYAAALNEHVAQWDGSAPRFVAGAILAWSWTPTDVLKLTRLLDDRFEVVLGDAFFELLRASR